MDELKPVSELTSTYFFPLRRKGRDGEKWDGCGNASYFLVGKQRKMAAEAKWKT